MTGVQITARTAATDPPECHTCGCPAAEHDRDGRCGDPECNPLDDGINPPCAVRPGSSEDPPRHTRPGPNPRGTGMTIATERPTNPLRRGVHRPAPNRHRVTGRDLALAGVVVAALAVGVRYVDAEQASAASRSGSVWDLMLGDHVHHESPWDFSGTKTVTCYETGPAGSCDTDPAAPGVQEPVEPLTHLKAGAACPAAVPQWATCDGGRP